MGKEDRKLRRAAKSSPLDWALDGRDQQTLDMVNEAIQHKEVLLAYQPVVLAENPTMAAHFEALIRVLDETGRVIPARDFFAQVEVSEAGRKLDCLSLSMGLKTLRDNPDIVLSINMSARSIGYRNWKHILNSNLKRDPTLGRRLILEISETSVLQVPELVMDFMDEYQQHSVAFALDDYGADLTSYRHLKDFSFNYIKLDASFAQSIQTDPKNQALTYAISYLAQQFGMFTVATRIESMDDASTLHGLGVRCLQGYCFGAPTVNPPWNENKNSKTAT